ncbi:MAG: hypothetical protein ACUZ8I_14995 [Candidatus Scalindua sp.]
MAEMIGWTITFVLAAIAAGFMIYVKTVDQKGRDDLWIGVLFSCAFAILAIFSAIITLIF